MSTEALVAAVVAMTFDVSESVAREHVEAALTAAEEFQVPVELLLAMSYCAAQFTPEVES
jgi:hypothetical protein